MVPGHFLIEDARGCEFFPELHNELVEEDVGGTFIVVHAGHGSGCDAVLGNPAVALGDIILKGDGSFDAGSNASCNGSRVDVNIFPGGGALVEPEKLEVHLGAEKFGILFLPLVDMQGNQSHFCLYF